jgi:TrmH family RNA methyltransferase
MRDAPPPPISSRSNARVKALRAALSGKPAQPGELMGLEGATLLAEAARAGIVFETVFLRAGSESVASAPELANLQAREWLTLQEDAFKSAVDTVSPQGIAATFTLPEFPPLRLQRDSVVLVLEALQDPGNLGTVLRSAEAFGAQEVFVTPTTVNAWNPKVVRASAGSVFRVPVRVMPLADLKKILRKASVRLFAAVAQEDGAVAAAAAKFGTGCALLVGNEGAGLSAEALKLADERVHIPCATESLNAAVASSVLLYEAMRQRAGNTSR